MDNKRFSLVGIAVVAAIIFLIYKTWFLSPIVVGGDLHFYYKPFFDSLSLFPYAWDYSAQNSFGGNGSAFLGTFFNVFSFYFMGTILRLPWDVIERVTQLIPFLMLIVISPVFFTKKIFKIPVSFLSVLIFATNTYVLMLVGGGQILLGIGYALFPITLGMSILCFRSILSASKNYLLLSMVFAIFLVLQMVVDIRFFYMVCIAIGLFILFEIPHMLFLPRKEQVVVFTQFLVFIILLPGLTAFGLLAYWLLPTLLIHQNPLAQLGSAYTTQQAVTFFSFAKFENSFGLLHPNWPENVFGLTHFMRPEFLILPLIAFSSLFFILKIKNPTFADAMAGKQKSLRRHSYEASATKIQIKNKTAQDNLLILYFCVIGLVGAFLAKGANDPFGGIYLWMFNYIPGFVMFRDPTKWYTFVAFSYAILIPYVLSQWIISKKKLTSVVYFSFIILWLYMIWPAVSGQLSGTFTFHRIPSEYISLEKSLDSFSDFSRILWLPQEPLYGFSSAKHPAVVAEDFFHLYTMQALINVFKGPQVLNNLKSDNIRYIVIPDDTERQLFLTDRKYDNSLRNDIITSLESIKQISKKKVFGNIVVYDLGPVPGLFYSSNQSTQLISAELSPDEYHLKISNAIAGERITFSQSYDNHWIAIVGRTHIASQRSSFLSNTFMLPANGSYQMDLYYEPQQLIKVGMTISLFSAALIIGILAWLLFMKKTYD